MMKASQGKKPESLENKKSLSQASHEMLKRLDETLELEAKHKEMANKRNEQFEKDERES